MSFACLLFFLVPVRIPPLPYNFSQADVGPFVPQRFEPPADAYGNEARGVRQIGDAVLGDVLFSRASSLVDESRPKMSDLLLEKDKDASETLGYQMIVDKKIEWGIIHQDGAPADAQDPSYLGHSRATQRSQVEVEKEKKRQKQESWQPSQKWGSTSSSWCTEGAASSQREHDWQQDEWAGASWSQGPSWSQREHDWQQDGWQGTQAWASSQPPRDPRGVEILAYWGSGAKRW